MAKTEITPKKYKFPKDLGACLKLLAGLQRQAELLAARGQPVAAEEAALREHLLGSFKKSELDGAKGSGIALSVTRGSYPTLRDWKKFLAYCRRPGNEDLLQHSVNTPAWRERFAAGKGVPGVEVFDRVGLSVRRAK